MATLIVMAVFAAWHCDYMVKRAYIKHTYNLTMSQSEKTQAVTLLMQCARS